MRCQFVITYVVITHTTVVIMCVVSTCGFVTCVVITCIAITCVVITCVVVVCVVIMLCVFITRVVIMNVVLCVTGHRLSYTSSQTACVRCVRTAASLTCPGNHNTCETSYCLRYTRTHMNACTHTHTQCFRNYFNTD